MMVLEFPCVCCNMCKFFLAVYGCNKKSSHCENFFQACHVNPYSHYRKKKLTRRDNFFYPHLLQKKITRLDKKLHNLTIFATRISREKRITRPYCKEKN